MEPTCVIEGNSKRGMAGKHLRNRSIIVGKDSISHRDSNEVNEFSSLDNTTVNQRVETEELGYQSVKLIIMTVLSQLK